MSNGAVRRLADDEIGDPEIAEEWLREVDDPDVRGINVWRPNGTGVDETNWRVQVAAAELIREEPLEGELRHGIMSALLAVSGVDEVIEEDREQWMVLGSPSGEALVNAAGEVVDALAERVREVMKGP